MLKILTVFILVLSVFVSLYMQYYEPALNIKDFDLDKFWGQQSDSSKDETIRKIELTIDEKTIYDLRQRLANRKPLRKSLNGVKSEYGINTKFLNEVLDYWEHQYNFEKRFELLNKFDHYKTKIQGLDIHFIRAVPKSEGLKVVPLLMLHGWPSSSKEFVKVIPHLTAPRQDYDFVFEVIAADLPGYGFSEGTDEPGMSPLEIGIIMRNLMHRLGYKKFYIQAGDWGSVCASNMVTIFPDEILGYHTNMPSSNMFKSYWKVLFGSLFPTLIDDPKHLGRLYPLSGYLKYVIRETGYMHLQATKPDTIGAALTDTPSGLAAYLIEKISVITNSEQLDTEHGGLASLDLDDVLDTVTIMWINNCVTSATRLYLEGLAINLDNNYIVNRLPTPVPTAALKFKYEVYYQPDWILRDKYPNLVRSTSYDFGGHFPGMENPLILAQDLFDSLVEFLKFHAADNN